MENRKSLEIDKKKETKSMDGQGANLVKKQLLLGLI